MMTLKSDASLRHSKKSAEEANIFIIGSKGIPAQYGGFETFVDQLTARKQSQAINYHVSCMSDNRNEFFYNRSRCFNIPTANIGSAKAIIYDIQSLRACIKYIKKNNLKNCMIYILACRIGPVFFIYKRILERMNVRIFINPDGNEWRRSKWSAPIRRYWKYSEKQMVKHADYIICDSLGIESYIHSTYSSFKPQTQYISYGADLTPSVLDDKDEGFKEWLLSKEIREDRYFLIVGRFVPENNYELMILEFMESNLDMDLVIVTNIAENNFYSDLKEKTAFNKDKRIKFVGTIYDQELLKKIREKAFAYLHGHEVGGTNPSLLEALASTKINILLDVVFNNEVGRDAALYFSKHKGSLKHILESTVQLSQKEINDMEVKSKRVISTSYSWNKIVSEYETFFKNQIDFVETGTENKDLTKAVMV
ncbi:beta 1-4 rhamnosyltransferase Cps2T [Paenibacillus humicus]|uniref:beta 1-4 rhamnosyltransferase Cps2T n=1 Tax=Paenibacillus humicus TaxID=412861 RepID=UPI0027D951BE|nr:DUF1972 domain-containing protein [Paenibacillus humicus]